MYRHTHHYNGVDCICPKTDLSRELAKLGGAVAGSIIHDLIEKHRPLIALKAKVITWKQFRHLRVQQPASK